MFISCFFVPNQVWTFRLAKLEGIDGVDQVALHAALVNDADLIGDCDCPSMEYKSFKKV